MARRRSLSSMLYRASRATRDIEVVTGEHGVERYAKRRLRRKGLGWWFRKTGL
jgi:hypothetical protein